MRRETSPTTALRMTVPTEMDKPCKFYHETKCKADMFGFDVLK